MGCFCCRSLCSSDLYTSPDSLSWGQRRSAFAADCFCSFFARRGARGFHGIFFGTDAGPCYGNFLRGEYPCPHYHRVLFGQFSDRVFKEQFFLPVLASVAVTILNYFILSLLMVLLGYRFNLESHMQQILVPMLLYQLAFSYPVHYLAYRLDKRLEEKK